jgi:hypothetical protein
VAAAAADARAACDVVVLGLIAAGTVTALAEAAVAAADAGRRVALVVDETPRAVAAELEAVARGRGDAWVRAAGGAGAGGALALPPLVLGGDAVEAVRGAAAGFGGRRVPVETALVDVAAGVGAVAVLLPAPGSAVAAACVRRLLAVERELGAAAEWGGAAW